MPMPRSSAWCCPRAIISSRYRYIGTVAHDAGTSAPGPGGPALDGPPSERRGRMTPNPISHVLEFLTQPAWTTGIYWLLLLGSLAIAAYVLATIERQRSLRHIGDWLCRFIIGSMWWQQTLWKVPPYYTDQPDQPLTSGLAYWIVQMGKSAWIPLQ